MGAAPIFDNGRRLLFKVPDDMLGDSAFEVACQRPSFGGDSFRELAGRIMGERQLGWLESLSRVDLMDYVAPLTDESLLDSVSARVVGLRPILSARLDELRSIPPVDRDAFVERLLDVWEARVAKRSHEKVSRADPRDLGPRVVGFPGDSSR